MKFILEISPQHAGTRFLHSMICNHPLVTATCDVSQAHKVLAGNRSLRSHIISWPESIALDDKVTVLHQHLFTDPIFMERTIPLMLALPTVIPIRDPLAALCSIQVVRQQKGYSEEWILDHVVGWEHLAKLGQWKSFDNFFFPVDLPSTPEQRLTLCKKMLAHLGLPYASYVEDTARSWIPVGTKGNYPLKTFYQARNLAALKNVIPSVIERLQASTELRQFLQLHGYKDLFWWN